MLVTIAIVFTVAVSGTATALGVVNVVHASSYGSFNQYETGVFHFFSVHGKVGSDQRKSICSFYK